MSSIWDIAWMKKKVHNLDEQKVNISSKGQLSIDDYLKVIWKDKQNHGKPFNKVATRYSC